MSDSIYRYLYTNIYIREGSGQLKRIWYRAAPVTYDTNSLYLSQHRPNPKPNSTLLGVLRSILSGLQ